MLCGIERAAEERRSVGRRRRHEMVIFVGWHLHGVRPWREPAWRPLVNDVKRKGSPGPAPPSNAHSPRHPPRLRKQPGAFLAPADPVQEARRQLQARGVDSPHAARRLPRTGGVVWLDEPDGGDDDLFASGLWNVEFEQLRRHDEAHMTVL